MLQTQLFKLNQNPYITIKKFENIMFANNFKIENNSMNKTDEWNSTLNELLFENLIPQMWVIDKIYYVPINNKQVIVYIYVISHTIKNIMIKKLNEYCQKNFKNVLLK